MANKYWVGGTGSWTGTNLTNWSLTSGGAGGAAVPTTADIAIFDANSNNAGGGASYVVTRTTTGGVLGLSMAKPIGLAQTVTIAGTSSLPVTSSGITLGTGVLWTHTGAVTITGGVLTSGGTSFAAPINFAGTCSTVGPTTCTSTTSSSLAASGVLTLGGNLTYSGAGTTFTFNDLCTVNFAGFTLATVNWTTSGAGARTFNGAGGTLEVTSGGGNLSVPSNNNGTITYSSLLTLKLSGARNTTTTLRNTQLSSSNLSIWVAAGGSGNTVTFNGAMVLNNLDFTGFTQIYEGGQTVSLKGDLKLGSISNISSTTPAVHTFSGTVLQQIDVGTYTGAMVPITVTSTNTVQLAKSLSTDEPLIITAGTFDLNGFTYTSATAAATITMASGGTGTFITNGGTVNLSVSGASFIHNGSLSTVTANGGAITGVTGTAYNANSGVDNITAGQISTSNLSMNGGTVNVTGTGVISVSTLTGNSGNVNATGTGAISVSTLVQNGAIVTATGTTITASTKYEQNSGTLNLAGGGVVSTPFFDSVSTATRTIAFGTDGRINVTGNSTTVLDLTGINLTLTGTPYIKATYAGSAGTRLITTGTPSSFLNVSMTGTSGLVIGGATDTITLSGSIGSFDLTGSTSSWSAGGGLSVFGDVLETNLYTQPLYLYGTCTLYSSGAYTNTINVNGGTTSLGNAFTVTNLTHTSNTFSLNGFDLTVANTLTFSGAGAKTVAFGTNKISVAFTLNVTGTNPSATGTPLIEFPGTSGTKTINLSGSASFPLTVQGTGTSGICLANSGSASGNIALTGTAIGNVSLTNMLPGATLAAGTRSVAGDFTIDNSLTVATTTSVTTFTSSGMRTLDTNGVSLPFPVTVSGTTSTNGISLARNTTLAGSTNPVTLNTGVLDLNGKTLVAPRFVNNSTSTRTLNFNGGVLELTSTTLGTTAISLSLVTGFTSDKLGYIKISAATASTLYVFTSVATEASALNFRIEGPTGEVSFNVSSTTAFSTAGIRDLTLVTGTLRSSGGLPLKIFGSIDNSAGRPLPLTTPFTMSASSGTWTVDPGGQTLANFTVAGVGSTVQMLEDLNVGATALTLTGGTLDLNGFNASGASFVTSGALVRELAIGTGYLDVATVTASGSNFTATGTGPIKMNNPTARAVFTGGGFSWPVVEIQGSFGLGIAGANTFGTIQTLGADTSIQFPAGVTQTLTNLNVSCTVPGQHTLLFSSSPGTQATLSKSSGSVSLSNVSITDIAATGGATWTALTTNGNLDGGNNSGWQLRPESVQAWFTV